MFSIVIGLVLIGLTNKTWPIKLVTQELLTPTTPTKITILYDFEFIVRSHLQEWFIKCEHYVFFNCF